MGDYRVCRCVLVQGLLQNPKPSGWGLKIDNMENIKKAKFKIKGMHCASCEKIISLSINELSGIKNVSIDSNLGKGEVEYDQNLIGVELIKNKILDINLITISITLMKLGIC